MHTSWSRFCTVNHRALASNYQLSNIKQTSPRFASAQDLEVEGENSNHNITEPPGQSRGSNIPTSNTAIQLDVTAIYFDVLIKNSIWSH